MNEFNDCNKFFVPGDKISEVQYAKLGTNDIFTVNGEVRVLSRLEYIMVDDRKYFGIIYEALPSTGHPPDFYIPFNIPHGDEFFENTNKSISPYPSKQTIAGAWFIGIGDITDYTKLKLKTI